MATLLIVDDEINQRKLYQEELREEGYQIRLARNGKEALDSISEAPPDLVVLDIRMPAMDGLEALGGAARASLRSSARRSPAGQQLFTKVVEIDAKNLIRR